MGVLLWITGFLCVQATVGAGRSAMGLPLGRVIARLARSHRVNCPQKVGHPSNFLGFQHEQVHRAI
ncbi:hypothetical protein CJF35_01785 [Pseudomonas lundensis]|nr:hypothetical protein CJF35_01785 [Pseudomonas lundensis]